MLNNILQKTPARILEFWKTEGKPPFCTITVRGVSGIYELDEISSFIWLYLDGDHTVDYIITEICNSFEGAERGQVEQDIIKILKRWSADDLIHIDYNPLYPSRELKIFEKLKRKMEVQNKRKRKKGDGKCITAKEIKVARYLLNYPEKKIKKLSQQIATKGKSEILLITPPLPLVMSRFFLQPIYNMSPLGIGYIAAVLQNEGFRIDCLNLSFGLKELKPLEHYITRTKPKIVGLSTMTETYQNSLLLAKLVKKVNPDAITVFGGPHVTFMSEEALSNDCVDVVVRREGEYTMLELAKYFIRNKGSLKDIKGIAYKSNGKVMHTGVRPLIENLDELPYPVRDISHLDEHTSTDLDRVRQMIITSRGCPGRCKFCAAAALSGGRYRMRSVDNIVGELTNLKHKGTHLVFFADDTIVADIPRLLKLCSLTKELGILWAAEFRVDAMTKDIAKILKDAGCQSLQFGVESGSQELLDQMGKDITLQQIEQAVKWATDAELTVVCSMMMGLPEDTITTIKQTIDFGVRLQKTYKATVLLGCFVPLPGTYYYNHANKLGISIMTKKYNQYFTLNPIIDTPHLTRWQIRNLYFDAQSQLLQSMPVNHKNLLRDIAKYSLKNDLP